jgi:hypothetical protein
VTVLLDEYVGEAGVHPHRLPGAGEFIDQAMLIAAQLGNKPAVERAEHGKHRCVEGQRHDELPAHLAGLVIIPGLPGRSGQVRSRAKQMMRLCTRPFLAVQAS